MKNLCGMLQVSAHIDESAALLSLLLQIASLAPGVKYFVQSILCFQGFHNEK